MKKVELKDIIDKKMCVLCKDIEQAKILTERINELNPEETIFTSNISEDEQICITLKTGIEGVTWRYADKDYYEMEGYEILELSDIIDIGSSKIIAIVGCSASGKNQILNALILEGFNPMVSHTSRPMRLFEEEGKDYHFVSIEKAEEMLEKGEFIEHRVYHVANGDRWIYGISKDVINEAITNNDNNVVIVDYQGLLELKRYLEVNGELDKLVSVYVHAKAQTRLIRSLNREGVMDDIQVEEIVRRFKDDNEKVAPAIYDCDISITNEKPQDVKKAVELIKILAGE